MRESKGKNQYICPPSEMRLSHLELQISQASLLHPHKLTPPPSICRTDASILFCMYFYSRSVLQVSYFHVHLGFVNDVSIIGVQHTYERKFGPEVTSYLQICILALVDGFAQLD